MTARVTWKAFERRVARLLGGRRVPVTGRTRGDAPDIEHPLYALEVKLRKNRSRFLEDAMSQAKASARPGQIPVVVVGAKNRDAKRTFVVVELADFADWFGGPGGEAA